MGQINPKYVRIAYLLSGRLTRIGWLMHSGVSHVPPATAARVLGVSKARIRQLMASGRIEFTEAMPGGSVSDRFIPVASLANAPNELARGRPLGSRSEKQPAIWRAFGSKAGTKRETYPQSEVFGTNPTIPGVPIVPGVTKNASPSSRETYKARMRRERGKVL